MKTIVLYGMRGSGKSSVGKKLAKELGYSFVDLDNVIADNNVDITNSISTLVEYIEVVGWDEFRDEEHRCLKDVLDGNVGYECIHTLPGNVGKVISLGGGTIIFDRNKEMLFTQKDTKIIYLDTHCSETVKRITKDEKNGAIRNSLTGKTVLQEQKEVYNERKNIYENSCDFSVDNNGTIKKTISEIAYKLTWGGVCVPITDVKNISEAYEDIVNDRRIEYVELRLDLIFVKPNPISGAIINELPDKGFRGEDFSSLEQIIQDCPKKVICTLRHKKEGGIFEGTAEEQYEILEKCIEYGADYVDMELVNYVKVSVAGMHSYPTKRLISLYPTKKLILSYHNFNNTPDFEELKNILKEMKEYSPTVYKIACIPKSVSDVQTIFLLQEHFNKHYLQGDHSVRSIFISMGELGKSTRMYGPQAGGLLTFGSYGDTSSAPGQLDYKDLYSCIFQSKKLFGKTIENYEHTTLQNLEKQDLGKNEEKVSELVVLSKRVLFLGEKQIHGSFSPLMHNLSSGLLESKENNFFYTLVPVEKSGGPNTVEMFRKNISWQNIVKEFVEFLESGERFLGANVTMPFKVDMYEYLYNHPLDSLSRIDMRGKMVGAINTLYKKDGKIYATNTDVDGVKTPIVEKLVGYECIRTLHNEVNSAYILGSGGAARSAITAMIELGVQNIHILARNIESLNSLEKHFQNFTKEEQKIITHEYDVEKSDSAIPLLGAEDKGDCKKKIIINTLPFGFKADLPESPILLNELDEIFPHMALYFEAIYDSGKGDTPIVKKIQDYNNRQGGIDGIGGTHRLNPTEGNIVADLCVCPDVKICKGEEMLIAQAKRGFELWTDGGEFQTELIKNILLKKEEGIF